MISQWITAVSILYFNSHTRVGCDADAHKQLQLDDAISTHTPRVGCDRFESIASLAILHFNSHTPCGV